MKFLIKYAHTLIIILMITPISLVNSSSRIDNEDVLAIPPNTANWENQNKKINSKDKLPISSGMIIFHSYTNYDTAWDSELFYYDFESIHQRGKINLGSHWAIDHEMNAHPSPDGTKIVFMGTEPVQNESDREWDIYIWNLFTRADPINLTFGNGLRDEDPKFSPDGKSIVFKQDGNIRFMDLSGVIQPSPFADTKAEESMPYYIENGNKVLFTRGAKETSDIFIMDADGSNINPLKTEKGIAEYYPIAKDQNSFYYTKWLVDTNEDKYDQIYLHNPINDQEIVNQNEHLPINTIDSNNSDAYPVYNDFIFFSSTRNIGAVNTGYDLFLGDISTGKVWDLGSVGLNSDKEELGAVYIPSN